MPWFRVDDDFHSHPKVIELLRTPKGHSALALWLLAGTWCARYMTDGFVPDFLPKLLGFPPRFCRELVRVRLWDDVPGGYRFHDWADKQPARAEVVQRREKTRKKLADWRARKAAKAEAAEVASNQGTAFSPVPGPIPIPKKEEREEREAWGLEVPLACAPAPAREAPPWTAERQALAFRKTYLARRESDPSMGGKNLGDFHSRVLATAQARGIAPEKMFGEALEKWLTQTHGRLEKSAPYACFAQAWGELVDKEASGITPEIKLLQEEVAEALRVVRGGR